MTCCLELHETFYRNCLLTEAEYQLTPRIFHHLRIRWQTIRWDTIAACVRDPHIRNAEICHLDESLLSSLDPVRILESNPMYRDELLQSLRTLPALERRLNTQSD